MQEESAARGVGHAVAKMDRRLPLRELQDLNEFGRLQALHEAAVECLFVGELDTLTPGMRALAVLFAVVGDIDNGGFEACMYGVSGDWIGEAIVAARLVGADAHAAVLSRFVDVALGGDGTLTAEERAERLEAMSEGEAAALERLDDEFYALPPIDQALTKYVDDHLSEFVRD
jgi:hypothetical protein